MSREKKIVPKLRFKEFDEKYKLKKVEDEFNLIRNYSYSRNDEGEGKYHHVHYGDIHSRYSVYIDQGVNVPSVKTTKEHIELAYGDVIVADASEDYADLGKSTILLDQGNRKYIAGLHTFALRAQDNTNPLYFVYYSKTEQYKQYMSKIGTGTSVYGITRNNLQNMKYLAPSIEEQEKIGSFFKKIDKMIQLQQSKVNKVKDIKSAYLSEMFPKKGEEYPKKRFGGFIKPWKKYKLTDIATFLKGRGLARKDMVENGQYECILYGHLYTVYGMVIDNIIYKTNTINQNMITSQKGDVLIPSSDTTPTGLARASSLEKDDIILGGDINILRPNRNIDGSFLSYNINANRSQLLKLIKGTTVKHIYNDDLKDVLVRVPEKEEQKLIVDLFRNIDNQIAIEEEKLMKLEKLKQAYLNDMFV